MKLKQEDVLNINSNKVIGFTEDFINKKTLLKNLLDADVVNNMCEPAIQVCQWRARAVDGSSFNRRPVKRLYIGTFLNVPMVEWSG